MILEDLVVATAVSSVVQMVRLATGWARAAWIERAIGLRHVLYSFC
jgi:hypothetical protein